MARETARALRALARDESVADGEFARRLDDAIRAIIEVTPSIMPVTRVLHAPRPPPRRTPDRPARARSPGRRGGFVEWLDAALDEIARIGADLIRDRDRLFLYSMSSTVYRMIEAALERGKQRVGRHDRVAARRTKASSPSTGCVRRASASTSASTPR